MTLSAFIQFLLMCRLHPFLSRVLMATVTNALVTSSLHLIIERNPLPETALENLLELSTVQNAAVCVLPGIRLCNHVPLLFQLHWLPVCFLSQDASYHP